MGGEGRQQLLRATLMIASTATRIPNSIENIPNHTNIEIVHHSFKTPSTYKKVQGAKTQ